MIPNSDVPPTPDSITLLVCRQGHVASKQFSRNENGDIKKLGYDSGTYFAVRECEVAGIRALSQLLTDIEHLSSVLVIRGRVLNPPAPAKGIRRLKANFATAEPGHRWLLIDFDKIEKPDGLNLRESAQAVIEYLVSLLPPEFHDVSYHYQLSSSAGMGDPRKVSAHVWFWLSQPWTDKRLKSWGKLANARAGCKLIDLALFGAVQPHYTAAPIFRGIDDPFPIRSGLVEKARDVVSIQEIEVPVRREKRSTTAVEVGPGFEGWLAKIGDHPGGEGFHGPIISAIASYVSTHGREGTDVESLYETVRAAVFSADGNRHSADEIANRASREHIVPAIEGALQKYGDIPPARRKAQVVPGLHAHFAGDSGTAGRATEQLLAALATVIKVFP